MDLKIFIVKYKYFSAPFRVSVVVFDNSNEMVKSHCLFCAKHALWPLEQRSLGSVSVLACQKGVSFKYFPSLRERAHNLVRD